MIRSSDGYSYIFIKNDLERSTRGEHAEMLAEAAKIEELADVFREFCATSVER